MQRQEALNNLGTRIGQTHGLIYVGDQIEELIRVIQSTQVAKIAAEPFLPPATPTTKKPPVKATKPEFEPAPPVPPEEKS